ncbi:hemagglutinin repeat-containing protein [Erwinia sp. ErVv1]|uniref:two-partner secretion domain-containing protein n=1 Tax=Erwinia sp. ErVv1 TaxID=1603299 RepID=UPI0008375D99|nr:hemagglutinin repeat-containing protein [Erwinia sp. ErVv1]
MNKKTHSRFNFQRLNTRLTPLVLAMAGIMPVSVSAEITIDNTEKNRPSIAGSANGTPTISINDSGNNGVSHNKYHDFNVGKEGVIFNNSIRDGVSEIGGYVLKNEQLKNEARVILNEVTGAKGSHLNGTMEVFGGRADLIIANENGISVNGVSTINANNLTLSTGRVNLDQNGNIQLAVERGNVSIEGAGINTAGLSYFDIISRTAALKGEIAGNADLKILTGLNDYDTGSRTHHVRSKGGKDTPQLAIDGSHLGSMYGNRIQLISSESGAGVSHLGSIAGNNSIEISADGDIILTNITSKNNDVTVSGKNIALSKNSSTGIGGISAQGDIILDALQGIILHADAIAESGIIRINAGSLLQSAAALLAKNTSRTNSDIPAIEINVRGVYKITGELYALDPVNNQKIDNAQVKLLNGKYVVMVGSRTIDNALVMSDASVTTNSGGMLIRATSLENESAIITNRKGNLVFNLEDTLINNGLVQANGSIELKGRRLKNSGIFNTSGSTLLTLGKLDNSGSLYASHLSITTDEIDNKGLVIAENGDLKLQVNGEADALNSGLLQGKNTLIKTSASLINEGNIVGESSLAISADKLKNHREIVSHGDLDLVLDTALSNTGEGALLSAKENLTITGKDKKLIVENSEGATLQSQQGNITINHVGFLTNNNANVIADKNLNIADVDGVVNSNGLFQGAVVDIIGLSRLDNIGEKARIIAGQQLKMADVQHLENRAGSISSDGNMMLERIDSLFNNAGQLASRNDLHLSQIDLLRNSNSSTLSSLYGKVFFDTLTNLNNISDSVIEAQGGIVFKNIKGLNNAENSVIRSLRDMTIDSIEKFTNAGQILTSLQLLMNGVDRLINKGEFAHIQGLNIALDNISELINQGAAAIVAQERLNISGVKTLLNEGMALFQGNIVDIQAAVIKNRDYGSVIIADHSLNIQADSIDNAEEGMIFSDNTLKIKAGILNNHENSEIAAGNFTIDVGELQNSGIITAQSKKVNSIVNTGVFVNTKGKIISEADLTIKATSFDNKEGTLYGKDLLNVILSQRFNNSEQGTLASSGKLSLTTDDIIDINQSIESWGSVFLSGKEINNNASIISANDIYLSAINVINNTNSLIYSMKDLVIEAAGTIFNAIRGNILTQGDMSLSANKIHNQAGVIRSEGDMSLDADLIHNESIYKNEGWDFGPLSDGSYRTSDPDTAYNEKYTATISLPAMSSDLALDTKAEISSGGKMSINQKASTAGALYNEGGLIQSKGNMLIRGDVTNAPKYISASWYDYLGYKNSGGLQLVFEEYHSSTSNIAYLKFKSMYQVLDYIYGNGKPSEVIGSVTKTHDHAAGNFHNSLKGLAGSHSLLNMMMNSLFGPQWKASKFKELKSAWSLLTANNNQSLIGKKNYFTPADKAALIIGGDFTHKDGGFNNGIAPELAEGNNPQKNTVVTVEVGGREVNTIEEKYQVFSNKKDIEEIKVGISTLPVLSNLIEIKGLFEKSQSFINRDNASVTSGNGPVNKIIPMYETRPEMIDQSQYYGSDYFFERLNYDPDQPVIVIGDNYFITELIRRQLNDSVGSYYAVKYNVEGADLVKMLFDNVAAEISGDEFSSFVIGQKLTDEQKASLDKDIVWFVTENVDGVDVLVPQIYLAAKTIDEIKTSNETGAAIVHAGGNVNVDAESVNNINAVISAGNDISLVASGDINNVTNGMNAGIVAGGSLELNSKLGDITNHGSELSSGKDIIISADQGSVDIMASVGSDTAGNQQIGSYQDDITAGGNIIIKAEDISVTGVGIKGGNSSDSEIRLTATEGNVNFNDIHEVTSSYEKTTERADFLNSRVTEVVTSSATSVTNSVNTGGKFIVEAAKDTVFVGGEYNAGSGSITAGGDVITKTSQDHNYSKTTVTETSFQVGATSNVPGMDATLDGYSGLDGAYSSSTDQYSSGGSQSQTNNSHGKRPGTAPISSSGGFYAGVKQTTSVETESSLTNKNADFNFTGGMDIKAGNTLDIGGVNLASGENATINLSGENVISTKYEDVKQVDSEYSETFIGIKGEGHSSIVDVIDKYTNIVKADNEGKEIDAGRTAGQVAGDISNIIFNDTVGGSVSIGVSHDTESSSATTTSENINTISGGAVNITSGNDTTLKGVQIGANEVTVSAGGDFSLSSAENTYSESSSTTSHNAGVSIGGSISPTGSGIGASIDYSGSTSDSSLHATSHSNSTINAGQITVNTGGDMTVNGGNIVANQADLSIAGDLNISSVQDTYNETASRENYGGSIGASISTSGILPNVSAHYGGGGEEHDRNLTAQQSGIHTTNEVNVTTGGDLNLAGSHIISDSKTGSVAVGGAINATDMIDNKDESGMYQGGGGGISKNGTVTVSYYNDTIDEVRYKEEQHSTINVDTGNSQLNGKLNTNADKLSEVTEDRVVAGNNISATVSATVPSKKPKPGKNGDDGTQTPSSSVNNGSTDSSNTVPATTPATGAKTPESNPATPAGGNNSGGTGKPSFSVVDGPGSSSGVVGSLPKPGSPSSVNNGGNNSTIKVPGNSPSTGATAPATNPATPTGGNGKWPTVTPPSGFVGGPGSSSGVGGGQPKPGSTPSVNNGGNNSANKVPGNSPATGAKTPATNPATPTGGSAKWPTVTPPSGFVGGPGSSSGVGGGQPKPGS